jgi:DNA-3-methyladenine glycosylase I
VRGGLPPRQELRTDRDSLSGTTRCPWCLAADDYIRYHDTEWGFPVRDDVRLFEKLCLEGFQSGLSWLTILRKREAFRRAFAGFDPAKVARFGACDVTRHLKDASIVRHRGKIESAIGNARRVLDLRDEHGSLAAFLWRYEPARPSRRNTPPAEAIALSKDLKRRGFTFVGPTTVYALMQAMGLVNDHVETCFIRPKVAAARRRFRVPH